MLNGVFQRTREIHRRRVAVHERDAELVGQIDAGPVPQQILAAGTAEGVVDVALVEQLAAQTGVDEEVVPLAVVELQSAVELLVLPGKLKDLTSGSSESK